jgi:hypothetical protein
MTLAKQYNNQLHQTDLEAALRVMAAVAVAVAMAVAVAVAAAVMSL